MTITLSLIYISGVSITDLIRVDLHVDKTLPPFSVFNINGTMFTKKPE